MVIQHAMRCNKGFITIRHNDLRELTANLLTEVCKDVDIEPQLLPVTSETFKNRTANTSKEARVGIKSRGFWVRGQQAFSDVRVFDPNANRYLNKALPQCYIENEKKKEQYNERVLEIDHGSFTQMVASLIPKCHLHAKKSARSIIVLVIELIQKSCKLTGCEPYSIYRSIYNLSSLPKLATFPTS